MAGQGFPTLPDENFAEIAVDLGAYVTSFHDAATAWQMQIGRGLFSPGVEHTIAETAKSAMRARQVRQFFVDMQPYEQELRDFVAGLRCLASERRARMVG